MTNAPETSAEDSLIARYFKPLATDPGAFGLVDDAAVLSSSGDDIVVTTDAVVEGVHYLAGDPPDTIARKALRVNLSDLAAKGAVPAGFVLTLALRSKEDAWLRPFADALGEDATTFACPLLGGDTVSTPGPQMISITAFGRVPQGQMVGRTGARPGDRILVTGTIGDAALGLDVLTGGAAAAALATDPAAWDALVRRYRVPQPRNVLARAVRDHATAGVEDRGRAVPALLDVRGEGGADEDGAHLVGDRAKGCTDDLELDVHFTGSARSRDSFVSRSVLLVPSLTPTHPGGSQQVAPSSSTTAGPVASNGSAAGSSNRGPGRTSAVLTATSSIARSGSA